MKTNVKNPGPDWSIAIWAIGSPDDGVFDDEVSRESSKSNEKSGTGICPIKLTHEKVNS